jgi:hypothetical protein
MLKSNTRKNRAHAGHARTRGASGTQSCATSRALGFWLTASPTLPVISLIQPHGCCGGILHHAFSFSSRHGRSTRGCGIHGGIYFQKMHSLWSHRATTSDVRISVIEIGHHLCRVILPPDLGRS